MYAKLALRNIRRSLRDYIIYFVTLTLTAALMYSFLALGFSSDVLAMAENMSMLTTGILLMSALVAFMSSFVIGYAIRFMLGRRKKEFATYELIGMEAKTVRNLFLAENSIIGTGAFLLGSLVGTGLSGLLNQVVKNIFEVPHTYQVSFSLQAWAVTFLFFALMYGFGMLRAAKIIRHQKVIDLLYDNRKNEEYHFKSFRHSLLVVLLSIAAMVAGVILLGRMLQTQTNEAFLYLGGKKLYELARKGQEVERKPRNITIFDLAVEDGSGSDWDLRVRCSKGTYVRTLCHDIGQSLGCGGCMSSLRRTRAGRFTLEQAVTMEQILAFAQEHDPAELLMPVDALFAQHPALIVTLGQTEKLKHGASIRDWHFADGTYRVYSETGEFLLLGTVKGQILTTVTRFFEV